MLAHFFHVLQKSGQKTLIKVSDPKNSRSEKVPDPKSRDWLVLWMFLY